MLTVTDGEDVYKVVWGYDGPRTVCQLWRPVKTDETPLAEGVAVCHTGDIYSKRKGRLLAFERAVRELTDGVVNADRRHHLRGKLWGALRRSGVRFP